MVKTTLREARTAAGLSIRIAAEAAGVSESSYGNYEHGFYYPRPDARERLCALFGAGEADLWPEGNRRFSRNSLLPPPPPARHATAESLRRASRIRPGEHLRARGRACTVLETGPHFFTVSFDRTGVRECCAYQAFLADGEWRRVRA